MNAFRMRFHPFSRFFGKQTSGSFVTFDNWESVSYSKYGYEGLVYNGSLYSNYNNEGFLIHKGNPVDEKVWFTPAGVASGQDEVVSRALEWINNKVYPHDVLVDSTYYYPLGAGNSKLTTVIENPNSHQLSARGYIHTLEGVLADSADLVKAPGGEIWSGNIAVPQYEDFFKVSVAVFNNTTLDTFTLPNAVRFTTAGKITHERSISDRLSGQLRLTAFFKNNSTTKTIKKASVKILCNDPWVLSINPLIRNLPDLAPGATDSAVFWIKITDTLHYYLSEYNFEIMKDGWTYWTAIPVDVEDEYDQTPKEFRLSQNYPNPFNPSTVIKYQLASPGRVSLNIYDILGSKVATLFDEYKAAGVYEQEFNAEKLASGIYFYRLKAGTFEQTRKMLLIK